jgi:hypothetical protein
MNSKEALAFIKKHGIVMQCARGPVANLAEAIAGGPIRGSWWGHPKGREIFRVLQTVSGHPDVLVCKLVDGKITFVHRRLWPALVKLQKRFSRAQLMKVSEHHSSSGKHVLRKLAFPDWVPSDVLNEAERLSIDEAERLLRW